MTARERDPQGASMPAARLEAIRERLAKATKIARAEAMTGPGERHTRTFARLYDEQDRYIAVLGSANVEFLVHAWEDIAWLLARLGPATPDDVARATEKMFDKMDAEDKATFNWWIASARRLAPATPSGAATAEHSGETRDTREERTP